MGARCARPADRALSPPPVSQEPPNFTLADLRKAVPPHCFKRSLLRSSAYLAADCCGAALLYVAVRAADALPMPLALRVALWLAYTVAQGAVCTGIWVVAHECGHGAFSEVRTRWRCFAARRVWARPHASLLLRQHPVVNDTVGFVFHSALLVPYFSWKFSHARHHAGTGSLERDEVFVPPTREQHEAEAPSSSVLVRAALLVGTLLVGWPLYLVKNAGSRKYAGRHADHFWPWSPVFRPGRERALVALSDVGLLATAAVLRRAAAASSWSWVARAYFAPYLVVNAFLVLITLLQHTHPALPHFAGSEWEWLRGACSTVDRSYGAVLNALHHHIADTHVCHHLFSTMPHYHAQEATEALKGVLGRYYCRDDRNIVAAMWADWRSCTFVDGDEGGNDKVLWFRA